MFSERMNGGGEGDMWRHAGEACPCGRVAEARDDGLVGADGCGTSGEGLMMDADDRAAPTKKWAAPGGREGMPTVDGGQHHGGGWDGDHVGGGLERIGGWEWGAAIM